MKTSSITVVFHDSQFEKTNCRNKVVFSELFLLLFATSKVQQSQNQHIIFYAKKVVSQVSSSKCPAGIYLLKINNRNTRIRKISSKLTIKTPERHQCHRSSAFIVNTEHTSHLVLVFFVNFEHVIAGWVTNLSDY